LLSSHRSLTIIIILSLLFVSFFNVVSANGYVLETNLEINEEINEIIDAENAEDIADVEDDNDEKIAEALSIISSEPASILGYHNLSEVENKLYAIETAYPSIAKVFDLTKLYPYKNGTPKLTTQGRHVLALKLSDNPAVNESSEPEVLYMALHHSREWISVEVIMYFLDHVLNNYQTNTTLGNIINNTELWIVPIVNPDGFHYSQYVRDDINESNSNQWRKNMNESNGVPGFQDYDWARGDGVDLNRNYGYQWGYNNVDSSSDSNNSLYRGTAPFSEVETQLIRDFAVEREFKLAISLHSYSQAILFPWAYDDYDTAHDALFGEIAKNMSQYNNYVHGNPKDGVLYNCNGECTDWLYWNQTCLGFTIELGTQFIPIPSQILPICKKNLEPCILIAKIAGDPYQVFNSGVRGQIKDTQGRPVSGVNVSTKFAGESFWNYTNTTGHYKIRLPVGSYVMIFECDGYWPKSSGIGVIQDSFSNLDITLVDNVPPKVSSVWASTMGSAEAKKTFIIGATVLINVEELNSEKGLTGSVVIRSNATGFNSGKQPLIFDHEVNNYYYPLNTSSLNHSLDYIIEGKLKDYDLNADNNGSNDTGPDLILTLEDHRPPEILSVDSMVKGSAEDSDEHYEIGSIVRIVVKEKVNEIGLNGSLQIISESLDYESGEVELSYNSGKNYYYFDWSTDGLEPAADYEVETKLWDKLGNVDADGLETNPDLTITLVDATPPEIIEVDSSVGKDTDEKYSQGSEILISILVSKYEAGLIGEVDISSQSIGYTKTIEPLIYDQLNDNFYVLWNTTDLHVADDYIIEARVADKFLNYDMDGSVAGGPDLVIKLVDITPPVITEVNSFVGSDDDLNIDDDNTYELGSMVWIVVKESNNEPNLNGIVQILSKSSEFDSGKQYLTWDNATAAYTWLWDTGGFEPATDFEVETTLIDSYGNIDPDGLSTSPDITITLEDTTAPEVFAVYSRVGSDSDNSYDIGSTVEIIVYEKKNENNLTGTVYISSRTSDFESVDNQLIWKPENKFYFFLWDTSGLKPGADYHVETTLQDRWGNIDSDGLAVQPDLVIILTTNLDPGTGDKNPPNQVSNLTANQDTEIKTKVHLNWDDGTSNGSVLIYRSNEPITTTSGLLPLYNISENSFIDSLPKDPGTYFYLVIAMDSFGNINHTISESNSVNVTLTDSDLPSKLKDNPPGEDSIWVWMILMVIVIIIVLVVLVFVLNKRKYINKEN